LSAFDVSEMLRREIVAPVIKSALYGADDIVLIYEDKDNSSDPLIFQNSSTVIDSLLSAEIGLLPRSQQKLFCFRVQQCGTLAELKYRMSKSSMPALNADGCRIVNVFFLNNLASDGIVPKRKPFVVEDSDDECDAIPVGVDEWKESLWQCWKCKEPEVVDVVIESGEGVARIDIVADAGRALNNLVNSVNGIWIEGDTDSMCPLDNDVLGRCHRELSIVSDRVREMALWLHSMSNFQTFASAVAVNGASIDHCLLPRNIFAVIPSHNIVQPKFLATIGGKVRPEKFRVMEHLLDMVCM
jgi:hypothetical protein